MRRVIGTDVSFLQAATVGHYGFIAGPHSAIYLFGTPPTISTQATVAAYSCSENQMPEISSAQVGEARSFCSSGRRCAWARGRYGRSRRRQIRTAVSAYRLRFLRVRALLAERLGPLFALFAAAGLFLDLPDAAL